MVAEKNPAASCGVPGAACYKWVKLGRCYVSGLQSLGSLLNFEVDRLTLYQGLEAIAFNC